MLGIASRETTRNPCRSETTASEPGKSSGFSSSAFGSWAGSTRIGPAGRAATAGGGDGTLPQSIISRPLAVIIIRNVVGSIRSDRSRTEPSASSTWNPPGCGDPAPPSVGAAFGSKGRSESGRVQGTASFASTARIVFEVPSTIS